MNNVYAVVHPHCGATIFTTISGMAFMCANLNINMSLKHKLF